MVLTSRARSSWPVLLLATPLLAAGLWARPAVAPVDGACEVTLNGVDAQAAQSFGHAIVVPDDGTIEVSGRSAQGTSSVRIELSFPLVHALVLQERFTQPVTAWVGQVRVQDWARYGVGLYHVVATADGCTASAWIRVTGRSPFTTVAGLVAAGLIVIGVALQIAASVRTVGGRAGLPLAIPGGALTGVGALVLFQQFGLIPVTWGWLALWTVAPGGVGGATSILAREVSRQRASRAVSPVAPPSPDDRDPPRSAYAQLECPEVVVAERRFSLMVGLSPQPAPGVAGGPMRRPDSSVGPYTLSVQVVADGFRLEEREQSWRKDLEVTYDAPYPMFELQLAADPQPEPIRARFIQAMYSVGGQTMGMAVRSVAVVRTEDLVPEARVPAQAPGTDLTIPLEREAADLTVRIIRGQSESDGRLLWTFETPHRDIGLPDAPITFDIGAHPEAFAKKLTEQVGSHEGQPGLYQYLIGVGRTVADQVPDEFFSLLAEVARGIRGRRPMVLILSEEPYVPWELAVLEEPIDPQALPFLSVQANVGRWALGHRRPKLPPPLAVDVHSVAVVWGVYDRQEWRLMEAEDEAAKIREEYGAASVEARSKDVLQCLQGNPKADLLHFAVHGIYDPEGAKEGLVMLDGQTLDPMEVRGAKLAGQPFVFLNACQVGSGNQVLGDYAGMAEAFIYAGASGVVAPLWSVDDVVARDVALRFYERTLVGGEHPAEFLRSERTRFGDADHTGSSTYLAYQLFGHPAMKLTRVVEPKPS
jgi:hypothetical protein